MFAKEEYVRRRAALVAKMKGEKGILLFIGNVESPAQNLANGYKWRQDSNWLYFFGIDEPRFAATVDLESGEETIYADDYSLDDIIWTGPVPSVRSLAETAGITHTECYDKLSWTVSEAIIKGRPVHFLPVSRYYNAIRMSSLLGLEPNEVFSDGKAGCRKASAPMVQAVVEMRLVKSDGEIGLINEACTLGQQMHIVARKGIRSGRIEQEIVGEMEGFALANGWGTSFQTILTQHGEIFHCSSHSQPLESGKLLLIDAGLESGSHYASDFTRTYPISGRFTPKQRDIYQTVYEANTLAFSLTRPGIAYRDVHLAVEERILSNLKDLGLVRGNVDDMVSEGICGLFLPHGLGHNMGLDDHDMEDLGENIVGYDPDQTRAQRLGLGSLRMARRLQPGNVVSNEPGIYFIPALIRQWRQDGTDKGFVDYDRLGEYLDFGGIRLEDDILVTEDGARRLGNQNLPISPDEVEAAMSQDRE